MSGTKLWGGRFAQATDASVEAFTASLGIDARLWAADLRASVAHVRGLGGAGVLTTEETGQLVAGLERLGVAMAAGEVTLDPNAEDIHSEIERLLTESVGSLAGKVHTGRSRNDQVVTATRLYLREQVDGLSQEIRALQKWLVGAAQGHTETLLPGMTHLQHAQPVSLAHHLLAYFWMLDRDWDRLSDARSRINQLPLGSAALAGTSFVVDREAMARELGFEGVCENSLDAVSDRDFVVEFLAAATLLMTHLSRLSEELILWSTPEFGFVELGDAVTTGSSIMPQKKNPDVAELIRGRVGRVTGGLVGAVVMLKGLPLSYNRDLQEDKVHLFDGLDTVRASVRLTRLMLEAAKFHPGNMAQRLPSDFSNATDLADYLVRKGMTFREAHEVVGKIVRHCLETGIDLEKLALEKYRAHSALFTADVFDAISPLAVVKARVSRGGTSPTAVRAQIEKAKERLKC